MTHVPRQMGIQISRERTECPKNEGLNRRLSTLSGGRRLKPRPLETLGLLADGAGFFCNFRLEARGGWLVNSDPCPTSGEILIS